MVVSVMCEIDVKAILFKMGAIKQLQFHIKRFPEKGRIETDI